jgi:DNA uptake protein ComE-like DNA-binding protein
VGPTGCIDVNTATAAELERIIHVGPARALQIIELRNVRSFRSIDDLVRVSGIAARRLRDIRAQGLACTR